MSDSEADDWTLMEIQNKQQTPDASVAAVEAPTSEGTRRMGDAVKSERKSPGCGITLKLKVIEWFVSTVYHRIYRTPQHFL